MNNNINNITVQLHELINITNTTNNNVNLLINKLDQVMPIVNLIPTSLVKISNRDRRAHNTLISVQMMNYLPILKSVPGVGNYRWYTNEAVGVIAAKLGTFPPNFPNNRISKN
ncbi:hypothetical protein PPL_11777 [Heterostelium album PN500]|uniref:Uncharacterized protein n=1 Tax=Heterostelium pallidum (strain ATCC 26659 / Pp 5 / PN500) TaxID=670386 RepID=D3BUF7_HETP5|nr:hypothetical protein PPL_11777 [Heterostelium album PN500]EFA74745.1 hypothetical protein PPL_11777 [Heterostelium album PN500]|eukprot:XP_020426879.1 hypothetical protein PPL_11777 [Heterostelium album PN500]